MSSSLQDQLIQAGLADDQQIEKARSKKGRSPKRRKSGTGSRQAQPENKAGAAPAPATSSANAEPSGPATPKPAPPSAARTAGPSATAAERGDQIHQIVRSHRIDRRYAGVPYRFVQGTRIREVAVTASQQGRIARGELGVVADGERLELVPARIARRVRAIDGDAVLVLHSGESPTEDSNG
mgnify:CR=1 FL=1